MSGPSAMPSRISVIVCTYNDPRALDLIFCALARQTRMPDEILIADDGSGPDTAAVVKDWEPRVDSKVEHVWHVDRGFRKTRISNEAVRRSTGELLIFLDGDAIPHRKWVQDHAIAFRPNRVSCGRRVKLSDELSRQVDRSWIESGKLESPKGPILWSALAGQTKRYSVSIRLPVLAARMAQPRARRLMGVNFSLPREAFVRVNGYDEATGISARIDRELELRLRRCGYQFYPLLHRAPVFHIYHDERPSIRDEKTLAWIRDQEASGRTRCDVGYDAPFDPDN